MSVINRKDIVNDDVDQGIDNISKSLDELVKKLKSLAKSMEVVNKQVSSSQSWSQLNDAIAENAKTTEKVINTQKEALQIAQEEIKLKQLQRKEEKELTAAREKEAKAAEKQAKQAKENESLWKKQTDAHREATKAAKEAAIQYGKNSKEFKELADKANKLGNELKDIDASLGNHQRNVGNYGKVWNGVKSEIGSLALSMVGIGAIVSTAWAGITSALKNVVDFGKALSSLRAITGATVQDMAFFGSQAIAMSRNSQKSAVEIVKAFELVGSKAPALLKSRDALKDVTKWAITLAESSGGQLELADSVNAVTAAMSVFQKPASETALIANTMAAGSLAGSAGVDQIAESFKNAGPVLAASNLSLEQSVALTELLGEYQIYGAEAGTKLRGSLLKLKDAQLGYQSGTFNLRDALEEANGKLAAMGSQMEKDAYMAKVFGAENVTVGTILVGNIQKYDDLTKAVTGTTTALDQQSIQNDNLSGSLTKLGNKWDAFTLSLSKSEGVLKKTIDFLGQLVDEMNWAVMDEGARALKLVNDELDRMDTVTSNLTLNEKIGKYQEYQKTVYNILLAQQKEYAAKTASNDLFIYSNQGATLKRQIDANTQIFKSVKDKISALYAEQMALEDATAAQVENTKSKEDLIKLKEKEISDLNETTASTKAEVAARNDKLKVLNEELAKLNALTAATEDFQKITSKKAEVSYIDSSNKRYEAAKKLGVDLQKIEEEAMAKTKENQEKSLEEAKAYAEKKKELESELYGSAVGFADALFDRRVSKLEEEKTALDSYYARILDNENLTEEQRSAIEAERDRKKQELTEKQNKALRKQAIFEKALALGQIAIATARGIAEALKMVPAAPLFVAYAAATGALQAATVMAQPIPQYKKGTRNAKGGLSEIAEEGPELVIDKKYGTWLATVRQFAPISKGSTVLTARETAKAIAGRRNSDIMSRHNENASQQVLLTKMLGANIIQGEKIEQAIKRQRPPVINIISNDARIAAKEQATKNFYRGR